VDSSPNRAFRGQNQTYPGAKGHHGSASAMGPSSVSAGLPPVKYQEMSPEVTLVEFISTSAAFHGVKNQNIKQLEWDILKVRPGLAHK